MGKSANEMRVLIDTLSTKKYNLSENTGRTSYENPVSLHFLQYGLCETKLYEGLIMSYPIDKVIEYIKDYFKLGDDIYKLECANEQEQIAVEVRNVGNNLHLIERAMDVCGYFLGFKKRIYKGDGVEWVYLQFEPKFQKDESVLIRQTETHLYHLTPKFYGEKILKTGFAPYHRNALFEYPGRIYMLKGSTPKQDILWLCTALKNMNKSKGCTERYMIFDVDINNIPQTCKMYTDPNHEHGVFLSENLHPSVITRVGDIMLDGSTPVINWRHNERNK